jgi:hypothetical protein
VQRHGKRCKRATAVALGQHTVFFLRATGESVRSAYMVEQWDDTDSHVEELIALTGDYGVARAAYEEAVKRKPGRIVTIVG